MPVLPQFAKSVLLVAALGLLVACGSSSSPVVRTGGSTPSSATTSSTPATTSAPPSSSPLTSAAHQPRVTVTPAVNLRNAQVVRVRGTGFSPLEALQIIECADKGTATGPGDCNLVGMLGATSDRAGVVTAELHVLRGPFGGSGVICSAKQACLVSVTQASLSPTEQANAPIRFVATG